MSSRAGGWFPDAPSPAFPPLLILVLSNSSFRGASSGAEDPDWGGVAVQDGASYSINGTPVLVYGVRPGVAPYLIKNMQAAGIADPEVIAWATSGWSSEDILETGLPGAVAELRARGRAPDMVFYLQGAPNNTTPVLLAEFQEQFPAIVASVTDIWPGVPVFVASGTSHDTADYPYWAEVDAVKQEQCALGEERTFFSIFGIPIDGTSHPTVGTGGGCNQIADRLGIASAWP